MNLLPVIYKANKKAWMVSEIFTEWEMKLDSQFQKQKRKVLLFVDNCSAHPLVPGLKSVRCEFLPPNATSCLQPCDQGIIRSFKAKYKAKMLFRLIKFIDKGAVASPITLLDAIHMAAASWDEVTTTTLENCFKKMRMMTLVTQMIMPQQ